MTVKFVCVLLGNFQYTAEFHNGWKLAEKWLKSDWKVTEKWLKSGWKVSVPIHPLFSMLWNSAIYWKFPIMTLGLFHFYTKLHFSSCLCLMKFTSFAHPYYSCNVHLIVHCHSLTLSFWFFSCFGIYLFICVYLHSAPSLNLIGGIIEKDWMPTLSS